MRRFLTAVFVATFLVVLAIGPSSAVAETERSPVESRIVELQKQGFAVSRVQRTFLGRIRIMSTKGDIARELVIDRHTGEVLRDHAVRIEADEDRTGKRGEEHEEHEEHSDSGADENGGSGGDDGDSGHGSDGEGEGDGESGDGDGEGEADSGDSDGDSDGGEGDGDGEGGEGADD